MFMPTTADEFAKSYIEARRARVTIDEMGVVERAGFRLMNSASKSRDGEMCPERAMGDALWAGEIDVAVAIHEALLSSEVIDEYPRPSLRRGSHVCTAVSGTICLSGLNEGTSKGP